ERGGGVNEGKKGGEKKWKKEDPARANKGKLKKAERPPLQMRLSSGNEPIGDGHAIGACNPSESWLSPLLHFTPTIESLIFDACGPSSPASLSRYGSASFWNPDLSTLSTTETPMVLSLSADWCSRSSAIAGSFMLTSSAAACTHFF